MPTVGVHLDLYAGDAGSYLLFLFNGASPVDAAGDALVEVGNGYFTANVAESLDSIRYKAVVHQDGVIIYTGWLSPALSLIVDDPIGSGSYPNVGLFTLEVTVQDSDGNGVQGARVAIQGTTYSETSGVDGKLNLNVNAGTYTLVTSPPSGYSTPANVEKPVAANTSQTIVVSGQPAESEAHFDLVTKRFDLIQGDDYVAANDGNVDFNIGFTGDPSGWSVQVVAWAKHRGTFYGSGSLVASGAEQKLRVEWPGSATEGKCPGSNYQWQAKTVSPTGLERTRVEGPLTLRPS